MPFQYVFPAQPLSGCAQGSDNSFGPISQCRYDFTLFFEQAILSAVPSAIFLLSALPRLFYLYRQHEKTVRTPAEVVKLVGIT